MNLQHMVDRAREVRLHTAKVKAKNMTKSALARAFDRETDEDVRDVYWKALSAKREIKHYRYIGNVAHLLLETALGRFVDGKFVVQVDIWSHPWSHGWHESDIDEWEELQC